MLALLSLKVLRAKVPLYFTLLFCGLIIESLRWDSKPAASRSQGRLLYDSAKVPLLFTLQFITCISLWMPIPIILGSKTLYPYTKSASKWKVTGRRIWKVRCALGKIHFHFGLQIGKIYSNFSFFFVLLVTYICSHFGTRKKRS